MAGAMASSAFSIAHVSPYPWEAGQRGQRPRPRVCRRALAAWTPRACAGAVALAGAGPGLAPGAAGGARAIRRPCSHGIDEAESRAGHLRRRGPRRPRLVGLRHARRRMPALPIDVARTIEELLGTVAAGLRARARAVRAEHVQRGAAPLARAERRLVSLRPRAAALDARGAPLRGELLRAAGRAHREPAETAELMARQFPGEYRLVPDAGGAGARWRARSEDTTPGDDRSAGGDLRRADGAPAQPRRRSGAAQSAGGTVADRRGPAHAHRPLRRLRHAGRGAARHRARARPGRDRSDRPQRDLRRPGRPAARRGWTWA